MTENGQLERIIAGCQKGDSESFCELVDIYAKRCYGYFFRLTGSKDVSDDLLSELFVKLVKKIAMYKGGGFDGWIFKMAHNLFYDYLRSKKRQEKLLEAKRAELEAEKYEVKPSSNELFDKLQCELDRLDKDTRELIVMRYYSQMSFKELAVMRGEPIGTTLAKVHRGLKKLRELMER